MRPTEEKIQEIFPQQRLTLSRKPYQMLLDWTLNPKLLPQSLAMLPTMDDFQTINSISAFLKGIRISDGSLGSPGRRKEHYIHKHHTTPLYIQNSSCTKQFLLTMLPNCSIE